MPDQLPARQSELWLLIGLAVLSGLLGRVWPFHLLLYPFVLFNTFIHEMSHGLAALLTGGSWLNFVVREDGSGQAITAGGVRWIISSAGYVGSALAGGGLLLLATKVSTARHVLLGLGIVFGLLCLLYVRNIFGILVGVAMTAALVWAGLKLQERWANLLLLFLAVQTGLNALDSLFGLMKLSTFHRGQVTDAANMQQATGVPSVVWALLWSGLAGLILWQAIRLAYFGRSGA
ncbi:MAG TPA: M50 family metallopeptidase [Herpetosiphonaceae bacterium]